MLGKTEIVLLMISKYNSRMKHKYNWRHLEMFFFYAVGAGITMVYNRFYLLPEKVGESVGRGSTVASIELSLGFQN